MLWRPQPILAFLDSSLRQILVVPRHYQSVILLYALYKVDISPQRQKRDAGPMVSMLKSDLSSFHCYKPAKHIPIYQILS